MPANSRVNRVRQTGEMMGLGSRLRCVLVIAVLLVAAAVQPARAGVSASLIIDADSGVVLHEQNADTITYPASLTKVMTLYLLFEALDQRRLSLHQRLPVSDHAASQPPTKMGLRPGDSISVDDAILAMVTKSANDVAVIVAEAIGGSEWRFASMMTAKARQLGMAHTVFRNASGLPDDYQITTARDMALLGRAVLRDFPHHYGYFSTSSFRYGRASHRNHNRLLGQYQGLDGIKTGYIRASGFNLIASAERGGRRLVGVVLGGRSAAQRNDQMANLLDDGFEALGVPVTRVARHQPPAPSEPVVSARHQPEPRQSAVAGGWGLRVGTFKSHKEAARALGRASGHVGRILPADDGRVERVPAGKKGSVYVARFGDGDRDEAVRACGVLQKKRMACTVVRSGSRTREVASLGSGADIAASMLDGPAPDRSRSASAKSRTARPARNAWGVEVGTYTDSFGALAGARDASRKAARYLGSGTSAVKRIDRKSGPDRYLAHIRGLERENAERACTQLRRTGTSCTVLSPGDT